ncbi:hypothetical protein GF360_01535 [candidate division WWE3 bacterium]|nr:hypothetical protein [candidate division WWE3 bacterium]
MHEETLYLKTKEVLEKIQNEPILEKFYLAGGTALALQLGHRKSIDLDFFAKKFPSQEKLIKALEKYQPTITEEKPGTLHLQIEGVKISFLEYAYPLLKETVRYKAIKMASVLDIACMKIIAISQRSAKKDFVDLYEILQTLDLKDLVKALEKKYEKRDYQRTHILKSLTYFVDVESDLEPDYLKPTKWQEVKTFLRESAADFKA